MTTKYLRVRFITVAFHLLIALSLLGCSKNSVPPIVDPNPPIDEWPPQPEFFNRGEGIMEYTLYEPLSHKPVTLYYYIPAGVDTRTATILIALHGADRNGPYQITTWKGIAAQKGVMVFAPQFSSEFYNSSEYQLGGVSSSGSSYVAKPKAQWSYSLIEDLFDFIKEKTGSRNETYDMWGHSAGGQFTHRFLLWMPEARVRKAVASNAGYYTVPDPDGISNEQGTVFSFPYSSRGTPISDNTIRTYFGRDMTVHLGTSDISTTDPQLPTGAGAMAQGPYRYARGHFFFEHSKGVAMAKGYSFNWKVVDVVGVGHSSRSMVQNSLTGAAKLMYD
ncbi:MAG: hypothetical protein WC960_07095 [Bacteroidales bacterium]